MRTDTTTLRLVLVLASLALHTAPIASAQSAPESLDRTPNSVQTRSLEAPSRMGRMLKRSYRDVAAPLSKRRKHHYSDEEYEDYEDEGYGDDNEEESHRDTKQYFASDDGRSSTFASRASPDNMNDDDGEILADPDGNVQIKPALPGSSAASASPSLDATSAVPSNVKATLARVAASATSTSDASDESTSTPVLRKTRSSASSSATPSSANPTTVTQSTAVTFTSTSFSSSSSSATSTSSSSLSSSAPTISATSSSSSPAATQTLSSSNDSEDNTAAPFTGIWSTFNKSSRWFPIAVIITILVGIAGLVVTVALLQCIARSPRFSKKKERPMLIPSDSSWGGSATSRRSSLLSEKRGSIASLPASRVASTIGAHRNRDTYTAFPARPAAPSHRSSDASLVKEDFLPHSYDPDPETAQVTDIYPALSKFQHGTGSPSRRGTPAPALYPYPEIVPCLQRLEPAAHPYASPYVLSKTPTPPRLPDLPPLSTISRLPTILTPGRTPRASLDEGPHFQNQRARSIASTAQERRSQYGPRPGREERQSVQRASLNEQMLSKQLGRKSYAMGGERIPEEPPRLPVGVMERRRWERCST